MALAMGLVLLNLPPVVFAQTPVKEERLRIAVLDFKLVDVDEAAGVLMIDKLRSDLVNTQRFIVLDRAQSDKILAELERQQTGLTDTATSTKIGQQFNVARIVTGRVASVKSLGIIQVNVEMIDMRTAQIVVSKTLTYDGEMKGFILEKVPEIVALIAGGQPERPVASGIPSAPPGVVATPGGQGQVTLVWNNVKGAAKYNVYYSTLPGVNRATATKIANVSSPFRHAGLADDTAYYYIVTAENDAGESPDSNEVNTITASAGAAPPPVAKSGSSGLYVTGVVMLIVGGVLQLAALGQATTAADDAKTARDNNDADLYQQALDDRQSAEDTQGGAVLVMGIGGVLMWLGSGDSDSTAALGPDSPDPSGFQVSVAPRAVMAGYTMRW